MIEFVAYFSTAQDQLGYVFDTGRGVVAAGFIGGPALPLGTYRVENGTLVATEVPAQEDAI